MANPKTRKSVNDTPRPSNDPFLRQSRLVSESDFEKLTGFSRSTLARWISKGCPVAQKGGGGHASKVDLRAVWDWREEQVRAEAAAEWAKSADAEAVTGGKPLAPADILKMEQVKLTRLKIAREAEILVPRELVEYVIERLFGVVRQSVLGVPERIFRKMSGIDEARKIGWYLDAQKQCRAALEAGAQAVVTTFVDMEDRLAAAIPPLDDLPEIKVSDE